MANEKKHWLLILFHAARFLLGGVFIFASYNKILNPEAFAEAVFNYQILPNNMVNLTAIILPWLELIVGFCLIIGWWLPGAVVIVNVLMIIFVSALTFNLARGLDVHCGCFSTGVSEAAAIWLTLLRDTFFLVVSFFLIYMILFLSKTRSGIS